MTMLSTLKTKPVVSTMIVLGGLGMALEWADMAADGTRDERHDSFVIQVNSTATGGIQDTTTGHVISRPVVQSVRFLATDVSSGDWF